MRLKLTFYTEELPAILPLNYQYELSAWVYRVIKNADETFATFLHQSGYKTGLKSFKHFTFSNLQLSKFRVEGDRLKLLANECSCIVSFFVDKAAESFISGLFLMQEFYLGDFKSKVHFKVSRVEVLPFPEASENLSLETISPLVVARKNERGNDDYLQPGDVGFEEMFKLNLVDKYLSIYPEEDAQQLKESIHLICRSDKPVRRKKITLKAHTAHQTQVVGYLFAFNISAPSALLKVGLLSGFGKYNAQGFGCCAVL